MRQGLFDDANLLSAARFAALLDVCGANNIRDLLLTNGAASALLGLLGQADATEVTVYCAPATELNDQWWADTVPATMTKARELATAWVPAFTSHPSFGGWYLYDEPEAQHAEKVRLLTLAIRELDRAHPITSAVAGEDNCRAIFAETAPDIACIDYYPYTVGRTDPDIWSEPYPRDALLAVPISTPQWWIAQAHGSAAFNLRQPTADELRHQATLAAMYRAEVCFWFVWSTQQDWQGLEDNPTLLGVIGQMAGATVPPLVAEPPADPPVEPPVEPPVDPPATSGVPMVVPNDGESPESWWGRHPLKDPDTVIVSPAREVSVLPGTDLQALFNAQTEPTTFLVQPGEYRVNPVGKDHIHFRATGPGVVFDVSAGMRFGPDPWVFEYHTGFTAAVADGDPEARRLVTTGRAKDIYLKGIDLDHNGTAGALSLAACDGLMLDECRFLNAVYTGTFHLGHLNGNACLDHIWLRRCEFPGGMRHPLYLDGAHYSGTVECRVTAPYNSGHLWLCNNDFTHDYDDDGTYEPSEQRMARYIVSARDRFEVPIYCAVEVTGGPILVEDAVASGTTGGFLYQDRKSHHTAVYDQRGVVVRNNTIPGSPYALQVAHTSNESAGSAPTLVGGYAVTGNTTDAIDAP